MLLAHSWLLLKIYFDHFDHIIHCIMWLFLVSQVDDLKKFLVLNLAEIL